MNINKISNFKFNTIKSYTITQKFLSSKKLKKISAVPFVATPIVAYNQKGRRDANNTANCNKAIDEQDKLLKNDKISEQEYNKRVKDIKAHYDAADDLPTDVSSSTVKKNAPKFKASTDDAQHFEPADTSYHGETYGDMPQIYEPETGIQGISQHAEIPNFDDAISGTPVAEQLAEVADMLDNPVLTGVVAELLPGTKFFKPAKDLFDGDIEKVA